MKRLILLLALATWPTLALAAEETPKADVKPTVEQKAETEEAFRKLRKPDDEGLEKILDKKFSVPTPNVFAGFRILLWGLTIAGVLLGLFFAGVIVVFTLRILRKYIAPTVTGIPDATPAIVQLFDNVRQKIENKAKELEAEKAEIDKRLKMKKATDE